jgi:hypothetical protein
LEYWLPRGVLRLRWLPPALRVLAAPGRLPCWPSSSLWVSLSGSAALLCVSFTMATNACSSWML